MPISPKKRKKQEPEEEERLCGGCDRLESKCFCVSCECICCGKSDYRYNMRSNIEINEDFYELDMDVQLRNCMCMDCINNDSDTEGEEDWFDEENDDDEDDEDEY